MSSKNIKKVEKIDFVERFEEVCGSSQPAEVARLLNISYQAAKNYLQGRLPDSNVLITIAGQTSYSIHWLLTGKGEKFVEEESSKKNKIALSREVKTLIKTECREAVSEILNITKVDEEKTSIIINTKDIKQERVEDKEDDVENSHLTKDDSQEI